MKTLFQLPQTPMSNDHLVLAGGGHTHALMLKRWCMYPQLRPEGLITLVDRNSTTLYSGMIPGLIAGDYVLDEISIDLRALSAKAGVAFVVGEITGLNVENNSIMIEGRPPFNYTRLSLDVGGETFKNEEHVHTKTINIGMPIRPLFQALQWIEEQDKQALNINQKPFTVVGSGHTAVEVALALRSRWSMRLLQLQGDMTKLKPQFKRTLCAAEIDLISREDSISGPALLCTGNQAPKWLDESNLQLDPSGRVLTTNTFQAINYPNLFAVGDCGVMTKNYRPSSGVWAVRAAEPLAKNLERCNKNLKPCVWRPQRRALQIIGGGQHQFKRKVAWASWGRVTIGPHYLLWRWKQFIDRRFMAKFQLALNMRESNDLSSENMACSGCAAKLPAKPLKEALEQANLSVLGRQPQDAVLIASLPEGESVVQSVDGFPALISDPWLNGRLTTLHACSDLWSTGASAVSAQAVITLPNVSIQIQKELLAQSLSGINSALEPQGAKLIGGHTLQARSLSPKPSTLGVQIALSVNGLIPSGYTPWAKGGCQVGDELIVSRSLGSGVLFAAARAGKACAQDLDAAIEQLGTSQEACFESLLKAREKNHSSRIVHACTDITGFGLLGHLEEMLSASNYQRVKSGLPLMKIKLQAELIPSLQGALSLLGDGYASTLAPSNRRAWRLLDRSLSPSAFIDLDLGHNIAFESKEHQQIKELIIDPQTCGPLLVSCSSEVARGLIEKGLWRKIGTVDLI